jgi:hypothetical protein
MTRPPPGTHTRRGWAPLASWSRSATSWCSRCAGAHLPPGRPPHAAAVASTWAPAAAGPSQACLADRFHPGGPALAGCCSCCCCPCCCRPGATLCRACRACPHAARPWPQGDIEAVAGKSPEGLTTLFEQIAGSDALKKQ